MRTERLIDRNQKLRWLLKRLPARHKADADHLEDFGTILFQRICELDLEGIVAKYKLGPYVTDRENSNRGYLQIAGREELFERERYKEPVAGWHACALACIEAEAVAL